MESISTPFLQNWQWVKLGDILDYEQPTQYIVKKHSILR